MAAKVESGRRGVLRGGVALAAAGLTGPRRGEAAGQTPAVRGRLKQSVSRWCFGKMSLDELCGHAARIGYKGIDLLEPKDWSLVGKHGLVCPLGSLGGPVTIEKGLNRVENHEPILDALAKGVDLAASAQVPNLVCFSGNRAGMPDEEGLENCARGLRQIAPHAERKDTGFLAQEVVPTDEPLRALTEAFRICDV
jgi:hydroxypyruvate isomerase